jgi:hypothetical protein
MDDAVLEKASSFIDIMKSLFLSENPLYGRVDRTIDLQPMDYYESSLFYPSYSNEDKTRLYSVFGGIPYYNRLIDSELSVRENIISLIASSDARLENEVSMYLREIEFEHAHYENIKKVYSIWVCFDPPLYRHNTINAYQITEKQIVGEVYETVANYDLLSTVMICIGTKEDERYTGLLKLLDIWLSGNSIDEKRAALKDIFDAEMPARLLEKESNMCKYSDFVENRWHKESQLFVLVSKRSMCFIFL